MAERKRTIQMDNNKPNAGLEKNRRMILFCIVFFIFLSVFSVVWIILNNDRMNKEPMVEYTPDNTYEHTLYAVTDKDYRPFSYIRDDGSYAGMDVELIAEVANRLHLNLELELMDWDDAQERLKNGEADVILNMEADRVTKDSGLIATIPVEEKEYLVYGHDRVTFIGELYGKRIGSMQLMPELGLNEEIEYISTYREMFEKLEAGELDYIFCPLQVGDTFLRQMNLNDIVSSYAVKEMFGCIALREDQVELRDRINEVLREMHKDGVIKDLDAKWIVHYENITLSGVIRNHPAIVILIVACIILTVMFAVVGVKDARHLKIQEGYTRELYDKVATIERQNAELEFEKSNAEAANKAKSAFLFNMSHDIRTPLNAIIGFSEILKEHVNEPDQVLLYSDQIFHAGKGLLLMFNDVLDMAQLEDSRVELKPEECNLAILVPGLVRIMSGEAENKNQEITVSIESLKKPLVLCDAGRLTQIMINIISNAVKFTPEGGHIHISMGQTSNTEKDKEFYEFNVKDDGPGMAPEFTDRIFKAFEREKTSTQSGQQGTGLGLAIVKKLTDLMDGTITINTELGKGTEFIVSFEFPVVEEREKAGDSSSSDVEKLKGKKILLVEDLKVNQKIAEMMLIKMGCSVDIAENGAIAVDMIRNKGGDNYDLVLMDIQMPEMDGYEATRAIRSVEEKKASQMPIIALTANCLPADRVAALESGMNDMVSKPIDPGALKDTMLQYFK